MLVRPLTSFSQPQMCITCLDRNLRTQRHMVSLRTPGHLAQLPDGGWAFEQVLKH